MTTSLNIFGIQYEEQSLLIKILLCGLFPFIAIFIFLMVLLFGIIIFLIFIICVFFGLIGVFIYMLIYLMMGGE